MEGGGASSSSISNDLKIYGVEIIIGKFLAFFLFNFLFSSCFFLFLYFDKEALLREELKGGSKPRKQT